MTNKLEFVHHHNLLLIKNYSVVYYQPNKYYVLH